MLKEYSNAPVQEVTMAVHFEPIAMLNTINLVGRCFELMGRLDDYTIEEIPYQEVRLESEMYRPQVPALKFHAGASEIGCNLLSRDKSESIQMQNNRFAVTWVRQDDASYPRYNSLKPTFFERLNLFRTGASKMGNLSLKIVQSGIQYVNQVDDNDSKAHKKFNFINLNHFKDHEGISFGTSQRLDGHDEIGRLTLEAQTGYSFNSIEDKVEQRRMLRTILTFRGLPKSLDDPGLESFLDRGHDAIVSTFTQSLSEAGRKYFQENDSG